MKRKSTRAIAFFVLVGAIAVGGFFWLRGKHREVAIVGAVPARPDLQRFPSELVRLVSASEDLAKNGPEQLEGLAELSSLYQANGYYPEAIKCYRGLVEADPTNPRWLHRWAIIVANYGESADAVYLWQRAETIDAKYLPLRIHLADALLKLNRTSEAAAEYNHILDQDPENIYALFGLARIATADGRWSEAKTLLERGTHGSNLAIGSDLLVTAYDHLGMIAQADALRGQNKSAGAFVDVPDPWIDEIFKQCFDPYRLALLAGAADRLNDFEAGQRWLERAERYAPDDGSLTFQIGQHFAQLKNDAQAEHYFRRTVELMPEFSDGWVQLAQTLQHSKNPSAAIATMQEGIRHCPQSAGLRLQLAQTLAAQNQLSAAEIQFRESIRLRPEEAQAYMDLAKLYFTQERVPEGLAQMEAALKAEPGFPPALSTLAFYWISAGHEPEAAEALRQVRGQPRITAPDRVKLENAFQNRFGHAL